ncbi:hypothetical protein [Microlunatus sp. GCM10028923]|uniref:endo-beta-N-acetylglucosaminidase n=1 Tax=Microlunatus sp. GCM10028923 TaxID=3273400 RepID=UPI00361F1776
MEAFSDEPLASAGPLAGPPPLVRLDRREFMRAAGGAAATAGLAAVIGTGTAGEAAAETTSIAPKFATVEGLNLYIDGGQAALLAILPDYDPADDPDAKYFRSVVPRAQQLPALRETQAHPAIDPEPQLADFSIFYNAFDGGADRATEARYGSAANLYLSRFQQRDVVGYWQVWRSIPNPALTDAVHRNGGRCIAFMFNDNASNLDADHLLRQDADGEFIYGNKLVDLALYFGFDGYMFDAEAGYISAEDKQLAFTMFQAMTKRARSRGVDLYLQIYGPSPDSWQSIDPSAAEWLTTPDAADSYFLDYNWAFSVYLNETKATIEALDLDANRQVLFGIELEGYRRSLAPVTSRSNISSAVPPNGSGPAVGGIALFNPAGPTVQYGIKAAKEANGGQLPDLPTLRSAVYAAERTFWSGKTQNPAQDNDESGRESYGMANYVAERSVIGTLPFVTRFNTGTSDAFFIDGDRSSDRPWFNLGAQDLLPTWQWWTKDLFSSAITAGLLSVDYDLTTSWNGGSSLMIKSDRDPATATEVRLYQTSLPVPADEASWLSLTYRIDGDEPSRLMIGLEFEDDPGEPLWIRVDALKSNPGWGTDWGYGTGSGGWEDGGWPQTEGAWAAGWRSRRGSTGWSQAVVGLHRFAGRTISTLSVGCNTTRASSYKINIGELVVSSLSAQRRAPAAPADFAIEAVKINSARTSAELRLTWTFDPSVAYYDLYRRRTPDSTAGLTWLGRITLDCYYLDALPRLGQEDTAVVQLVPVHPNGRQVVADSATVTVTW